MQEKNKHIIIFLPNGKEVQYTTSKSMHEGDRTHIRLVEEIVTDPDIVHIVYKEDNSVVGKSYVRMPYILELW